MTTLQVIDRQLSALIDEIDRLTIALINETEQKEKELWAEYMARDGRKRAGHSKRPTRAYYSGGNRVTDKLCKAAWQLRLAREIAAEYPDRFPDEGEQARRGLIEQWERESIELKIPASKEPRESQGAQPEASTF